MEPLGPLDDPLPDLFTASEWKKLGERLALTPRQLEIARLICRGCNRSSIAEALSISPATVRMHMAALFKRLGVRERLGVVVRLVLAHQELARDEGRIGDT